MFVTFITANLTANRKKVWSKYFKIRKKCFWKRGYDFNYTIETDGFSCSLVFVRFNFIFEFRDPSSVLIFVCFVFEFVRLLYQEKEVPLSDLAPEEEVYIDALPPEQLEGKVLVAGDPGKSCLLHFVMGTPTGEFYCIQKIFSSVPYVECS